MTTRKRQIILDTDPGGDDTFALFWLLSLIKQDMADLVAITTAAGNVLAQRTFSNTSQLLHLTGYASTVVGRSVVMAAEATEDASHIHGNDGMGNLAGSLPAAIHSFETAPSAEDLIIDRLNAHPGEITLVAIAPLTNLAAAEAKSPGILRKAREIVIMGGAFQCPGNVTPQAEFNIWFNAAAAATVFQSRDDIVVLPLDVTTHLHFTPDMAATVVAAHPHTPLAQFLLQLCDFMVSTALGYRETSGRPAFLVHDAAAVGYLFYPDLFRFHRADVRIETQGQWTRGQTLLGDRRFATTGANAWVALDVDTSLFFTNFLADLQQLVRSV